MNKITTQDSGAPYDVLAVMDPRIGILCREGRTVYYVIAEDGDVCEADSVDDLQPALLARSRDEALAEVARRYHMRRVASQVSTWFVRNGQMSLFISARFDRRRRTVFDVRVVARARWQKCVRTYNSRQLHRVVTAALASVQGVQS